MIRSQINETNSNQNTLSTYQATRRGTDRKEQEILGSKKNKIGDLRSLQGKHDNSNTCNTCKE